LIEIDDKHKFLKPGDVVVECGAAPGAWTQVCVKRINATGQGRLNFIIIILKSKLESLWNLYSAFSA